MKPGWKTTEFWQSLIHQALVVLTLFGVLSQGDQSRDRKSVV